jgi:hypothetical protein
MRLLAVAVAAGQSANKAASAAGIKPSTARKWAREPAFRRMVGAYQTRAIRRALAIMVRGAVRAAAKLYELAKHDDPKIALAASRAILELGPRLRDDLDREQRLIAIEDRLATAAPLTCLPSPAA